MMNKLLDIFYVVTVDMLVIFTSDVNGFFPVEKSRFFFRKKTTKIKKTGFFLVSRIYILPYIYCLFFVFEIVSTLH